MSAFFPSCFSYSKTSVTSTHIGATCRGPREQDGPQGVAGRTAGQGALVEEALLLAQGALQRERAAAQLAHDAASSVPAFVRPRAKSAAHHFGSSAFRAPGAHPRLVHL